jgi:hypothetical protein
MFDPGDDRGELAVVECAYEDQAGLRSLGFDPLARDRCYRVRDLLGVAVAVGDGKARLPLARVSGRSPALPA